MSMLVVLEELEVRRERLRAAAIAVVQAAKDVFPQKSDELSGVTQLRDRIAELATALETAK